MTTMMASGDGGPTSPTKAQHHSRYKSVYRPNDSSLRSANVSQGNNTDRSRTIQRQRYLSNYPNNTESLIISRGGGYDTERGREEQRYNNHGNTQDLSFFANHGAKSLLPSPSYQSLNHIVELIKRKN